MGGLQHVVSPEIVVKPSIKIVTQEEWTWIGLFRDIGDPIQAMVNGSQYKNRQSKGATWAHQASRLESLQAYDPLSSLWKCKDI